MTGRDIVCSPGNKLTSEEDMKVSVYRSSLTLTAKMSSFEQYDFCGGHALEIADKPKTLRYVSTAQRYGLCLFYYLFCLH